MRRLLPLLLPLSVLSCSAPAPVPPGLSGAEATSLFGEPLYAPPMSDETRAVRERQLAEALDAEPDDPALYLIWYGRRLAYLGRFREAQDVFTAGVETFPRDARFLRHRGHRWISMRLFAKAEHDLERAAALEKGRPDRIEPDGQPNAYGIPLSTTQSNIHYHLGLARYLQGDFEGALEAYAAYRKVNDDDDGEVAIAHWEYMALRRLGREDDAAKVLEPIQADMKILENHGYHRLLLLYKGELTPSELGVTPEEAEAGNEGSDPSVDDATTGYGVGNWHYTSGRTDEAVRIWRRVLTGDAWHAFGYIAAEAEMARLEK